MAWCHGSWFNTPYLLTWATLLLNSYISISQSVHKRTNSTQISFTFHKETSCRFKLRHCRWSETSSAPLLHECLSVFWVDLSAVSHTQTNASQLMNQSCQKHTHFPSHVSNLSGSASYFNTTAFLKKHQNCPPVNSESVRNSQCRVKRKAGDQDECFLISLLLESSVHRSPGWKSVRKTWKSSARSIHVASQALKYKDCFEVVLS